ncbi:hypothetical protein [Clostridium beijerinckii]|uniref:hypothetical protein n=1 Tax=Clostridium beijerinckii TaxID=1520 RepID=UPI002430736F|nr:hypothetical protein [Clostridium beijerinckii]MDG5854399.1 hypothetical protein [Clostridium beijerinckii]
MDADRKKITWANLYKHVYGSNDRWPICELYDFFNLDESLELNKYGYQIKLKKDITIEDITMHEHDEYKDKIIGFLYQCKNNKYYFPLSGDADFGMKTIFCKENIIDAYKKMHMFPNFSLMPVLGGMNNKKGSRRDRFDKFIYYVDKYYETKDIEFLIWFGNIKEENKIKYKKILEAFLDMFINAKDYCKKMYLIDEDLVDDLIKNGKFTIENKMDTRKEYCELAIKYWTQREEQMKKLITKEEQRYLFEDIDDDKYQ